MGLARFFGSLPAAALVLLAASPAAADPPDYSVTFELGPNSVIDIPTGIGDPQASASINGTMSGSFDNGVGYLLSTDAIFERHSDFFPRDTNYLRGSGQLTYQADFGRLKLAATNLAIFDRHFDALSLDLTDVSLSIDRGFDLTDDIRMRLTLAGARRFEESGLYDRYSITPSASFSTTLLGLDAYLTASYSYRDFVFGERQDNFFSSGLTLSKTFDELTVGVTASVEVTRSSIGAFNYESFIVERTN